MSASVPENLPLAEELTGVFARMSNMLLSEETVETALGLVTSLAHTTLVGTTGAGVTLVDDRGRRTSAASSDARVARADALQYELDEGPCMTAYRERMVVRVDDVAHDQRWPRWARAVEALGGVSSALSAPMVAGEVCLGAIKVYGSGVGSYDEDSEHVLSMFAAQAAILLANMQSLDRARELSAHLKEALRSRDVISTAKGVIIAREAVDGETAFARLTAISQRDGRKLRDVAETVVRAAERRRR